MTRARLLLILFVAAILGAAVHIHKNRQALAVAKVAPTLPSPGRIAHAGGGFEGGTYLNSLPAMAYNYARGFRLFEVDLALDGGGEIVCIHKWDDFLQATGWGGSDLPGPEAFAELRRNLPEAERPCTLPELLEWLLAHPGAVLVSDFKTDRLLLLSALARIVDEHGIRAIPQVYDPAQYDLAVSLGFEDIIWTLYDFNGSQAEVLRVAEERRPFAVTMPPSRAVTQMGEAPVGSPVYLPMILGQMGIPTYVHTINDARELDLLRRQFGVSDVYTDFLTP